MSSKRQKVLITGGAGYIGRCLAFECERSGYTPILVDNFATSKRGPHTERWETIECDLVSAEQTQSALREHTEVHAVFHLAARALVFESCLHPELYFRNNISSALNIGDWAVKTKVPYLLNSSSCAVYGSPDTLPITETSVMKPTHPYGESKAIVERIFDKIGDSKGTRTINLRYFNPAGSMDNGKLGEDHDPETHLIPNIVRSFLAKKPVTIFGGEYSTDDGTCVRDFIHIADLVNAHILALKFLEMDEANAPTALNLGSGRGTSMRQAIRAAIEVFGAEVPVEMHPPRPGDPPVLVADCSLAMRLLNWAPKRTIQEMISDHRRFEEQRSRGTMVQQSKA